MGFYTWRILCCNRTWDVNYLLLAQGLYSGTLIIRRLFVFIYASENNHFIWEYQTLHVKHTWQDIMSGCRAQTKPLSEVGSHFLLPILHLREHSTDEIISGMHLRQIYLLQSRRPARVLDTGLASACGRQHYFLVSKKIPFSFSVKWCQGEAMCNSHRWSDDGTSKVPGWAICGLPLSSQHLWTSQSSQANTYFMSLFKVAGAFPRPKDIM